MEESLDFLNKKLEEFDSILFAKKTKLEREQKQDEESARRRFLLQNVIQTHGKNKNKDKDKEDSNDDSNNTTNVCYLNDPHVRLRFLRSQSFDVSKSVERMICFLEFTSELYGDYVADRPISVSDFSPQEEYWLRHSRSQYLPFRDRSGRRVQVGVGSINFNIPDYVRFKIILLLQWVVTEDVDTQRKGIVLILWPFDEQTEGTMALSSPDTISSNERNWENMRLKVTKNTASLFQKYNNSSPVRIVSIHHFFRDTPFFRYMSALYLCFGLKKEHWAIYRVHFGECSPTYVYFNLGCFTFLFRSCMLQPLANHQLINSFATFYLEIIGEEIENRYRLSHFNVAEALLPMTTTEKVKTDHQSNWVAVVKAIEEQKKRKQQNKNLDDDDSQQEIIECPSSNDVVFRQGRPLYKYNPGNMRYRELIAAASSQHLEAGRSGKYAISWKVVQEVEAKGGRFLEWTAMKKGGSGGMWIIMKDRKVIRDKIASALKKYNSNNSSKTRKEANKSSRVEQLRQQNAITPPNKMKQSVTNEVSTTIAMASEVLSDGIATNRSSMNRGDATFTSIPKSSRFGFERSKDRRPYFFLQPGQIVYDGSTKRRKIAPSCGGDFAVNCLPNTNTNGNSNIIPGHHHQSNDPGYNHKLDMNNAMAVLNMENDSSVFGKLFFPT